MIPKVENPFAWIVVLNAIRMVTGSNIKKPFMKEEKILILMFPQTAPKLHKITHLV